MSKSHFFFSFLYNSMLPKIMKFTCVTICNLTDSKNSSGEQRIYFESISTVEVDNRYL